MDTPGDIRTATDSSLVLDLQLASSCTDLPSAQQFEQWVHAALRDDVSHQTETELTIRIVDEEEIRTLNRDYRGKDYATNVLSFGADLPEELDIPLLGDLVICAPVITREAKEQHKTADAHWAHMVVHGTLHLLGYDHIEDSDAEIMEALEIRILNGLGYADPYADTDN